MALSGRIDGSVSNLSTYFSFYAEWTATQSIADNCSYLNVSSYWATTNTLRKFDTESTRTANITISGTPTSISKRFDCDPWDSSGVYLIQTVESFRINHNNDGTAPSVTISATADGTASSYGPSASSLSGSITLDTIPRYATVSQTLESKTETTATIRWTADATVDYIWYSKNNGSSWTGIDVADGISGTYTISGLTANTSYSVKTRVRRKDSQLTTDSSALSVKTYNYPYATVMPNFTIGDSFTIEFYNPLSRRFTCYLICNGTQISDSWTITGTSHTGFKAGTTQADMYATIPNAQSATYQVKCVYGSSTITKTGGTMSVNSSACVPAIGSVTYQDTNSTITAITGNNQKIVRNKSTAKFSATGIGAVNSATISSVSVNVNSSTYAMTLSGSTAVSSSNTIDSGSNVTAVVTVTDSRGLTATNSVTVTMLDWTLPSAIISLSRQSNYYSTTTIKVDANYSSVDGKNTISITYKARQQGTSSWTVTGTLSDNVASTFTADNTYAWDVQVVLTDRFSGTTTYNLVLSKGLPLIYFDMKRLSVGINKFPDSDGNLDVMGHVLANQDGSALSMMRAKNGSATASLRVDASGSRGVYDDTGGKWEIYHDNDGYTLLSNSTGIALGGASKASGRIKANLPINTSFKDSIAMGSYGTAQTTVPNFVDEVRFSSGAMGSVSIGTAYTNNNVIIPTGWYNFIYSPHRNGGISGSAQGDNCNYGNLLLMGMNNNNGTFRIRIDSGAIAQVIRIGEEYMFFNSVADVGQTVGSATVVDTWNAMPDGSILICQASDFSSTARPHSTAVVVICRVASGRGYVQAYGKGESNVDYRMWLNSSNVPTGVWEKIADYVVDTYSSSVTTNVPISWTIRKWKSGLCECFGIGDSTGYPMTQAYTNGYYFASRFDLPANTFTSVTFAEVARAGGTSSSGLISASVYAFDTDKVQFYAFDTRSETVNCSFMCRIIGNWK